MTSLPLWAILDGLGISIGSAECAGLARWLESRELAAIARAGIDVRTARVELEHAHAVIADQARRIRELEARAKGKK